MARLARVWAIMSWDSLISFVDLKENLEVGHGLKTFDLVRGLGKPDDDFEALFG